VTPSKLDRELAAAIGDVDEAAPPVARPAPPSPPKEPKGNVRLLLVLLVMAGGIVALVMSFSGAAVYSKSVDQVLAERAQLAGRRLRVDGTLVHGTLVKRDSPCEYRFEMQKNGAVLPVRYAQCVVPDTFRDVPGMDVGVTVEGKLASDGTFDAAQVLAKCPSKYEMKDRASKGESAPHAPMGEMPGTN
jgi:cytochrome c-type biogenesis protein CcmE